MGEGEHARNVHTTMALIGAKGRVIDLSVSISVDTKRSSLGEIASFNYNDCISTKNNL